MMPIVQTTADYKNCIPYICMCVSITKSLILNKIATVKNNFATNHSTRTHLKEIDTFIMLWYAKERYDYVFLINITVGGSDCVMYPIIVLTISKNHLSHSLSESLRDEAIFGTLSELNIHFRQIEIGKIDF